MNLSVESLNAISGFIIKKYNEDFSTNKNLTDQQSLEKWINNLIL